MNRLIIEWPRQGALEVVQMTAVFEIMQIKLYYIILFHLVVLLDQNIQLACMQVLTHIRTFSLISAMMKFVLHKLITAMYELCQCTLAVAGKSQHIYASQYNQNNC